MSDGDLVYFMIPVKDGGKGKTFYGSLFGWDFTAGTVPGGFNIEGPNPPGGLFGGGPGDRPQVWFGVADLEAALEKVRGLGGHASPPEEIQSGFMASCIDDQGTKFNLWAPKEK